MHSHTESMIPSYQIGRPRSQRRVGSSAGFYAAESHPAYTDNVLSLSLGCPSESQPAPQHWAIAQDLLIPANRPRRDIFGRRGALSTASPMTRRQALQHTQHSEVLGVYSESTVADREEWINRIGNILRTQAHLSRVLSTLMSRMNKEDKEEYWALVKAYAERPKFDGRSPFHGGSTPATPNSSVSAMTLGSFLDFGMPGEDGLGVE